jgi:hypothetical protein
MENVDPNVEPTPPAENPPANQPSWFIDEGVAATGERPEWFPQKFKTVKDALTSLSELEKKMGTAPVEDYDFGEHGEVFDKNHEAFKELTAYAKEKRVPQEVMSKMLECFTKYGQSLAPNADAEMAKLGPDGAKQIETLNNWAKANLSTEAAEALFESMGSAKAVKAMMEVRAKMIGSTTPNIPNGSEPNGASSESIADLEAELSKPENFRNYQNDEKYRNDYKRRLQDAARRDTSHGYVEKTS